MRNIVANISLADLRDDEEDDGAAPEHQVIKDQVE